LSKASTAFRYALSLAAFTALYLGAARAGLFLQTQYAGLSPLWPPSGVAVAVFWRFGLRWWPMVLVGEFTTALALGQPLAQGLVGGSAQLLEALAARWLLLRFQVPRALDRPRYVFRFLYVVLAAPVVSASIGTAGLLLFGVIERASAASGWFTWWLGDALGILILCPLLVLWMHRPFEKVREWGEWIALMLWLGLAGVVMLSSGERYLTLFFLLFPFVVLATLRCGLAGTTSSATLLTALVLGLNIEQASTNEFLTAVRMAFVGASAFTGYLIAALMAARRAAQRRLNDERERALVTLTSIGEGVIATDASGAVHFMNPVAEQLTGWEAAKGAGAAIESVLALRSEGGASEEHPVRLCLRERAAHPRSSATLLRGGAATAIPIEHSIAPINGGNGANLGAVVSFRDVSEERKLRSQLAYQARHDALTSLFNRGVFEVKLKELVDATMSQGQCALLYLDLDQFKLINDTCGHEAGDLLLRDLGQRLAGMVLEPHVFARLGGDEFGVLLDQVDEAYAMNLAERLRRLIMDFRFEFQELTFRVGVSIGVTFFSPGQDTPAAILSRADVACYMAKEEGRNRIHVYRSGDLTMIQRHSEIQWISQLQSALQEGRFCLFWQRIYSIAAVQPEDACEIYEVLLRLTEGEKLISPAEFIPIAERFGFMPVIDRWVIEQACQHLWAQPNARLVLSINLTGATLDDPGFYDFVLGLQSHYGVDPKQICFEITETVAINRLTRAVETMRKLAEHGYRFALDDFGSGVASFGYLAQLPVQYVKVDGRFVQGLSADPANAIIVETLAKLAHMRGISCIAEWVESGAVIDQLKRVGVEFAQGYFLHRPEAVSRLPQARSPEPAVAGN
jgi:diguanylate cyclase (GGDEF)-like protein/PAS domain S-box-containing protein